MTLVSVFSNAMTPTPISALTPERILERIRSDEWKKRIEILRSLEKTEYDEQKKYLTSISWSGEFKYRNKKNKNRIQHSGLICLDFDEKDFTPGVDVFGIRSAFQGEPWTFATFVSPSGRGVKILVRIDGSRHEDTFDALREWSEENIGIAPDESGRDVCRLCFVSWDPGAWHNPDATVYEVGERQPEPPVAMKPVNIPLPQYSTPGYLADKYARRALENEIGAILSAANGQRNNTLNKAALSLGQLVAGGSLDRGHVESELTRAALSVGLSESETQATIRSGLSSGMDSPRTAPQPSSYSGSPQAAYSARYEARETTPAQGASEPEVAPQAEIWTAEALAKTELTPSAEDPDCLLGDRFLCVGGGGMIFSTSGIGKSVLTIQAAIAWATRRDLFGIQAHRPLRSLILQAENDYADTVETVRGICHGLTLRPEHVADRVQIVLDRSSTGAQCIRSVEAILARAEADNAPFDLVFLDPLMAFLGGDASDQECVSAFLRHGLGGLLQRHRIGVWIVHHTPKVSTGKGATERSPLYAYHGSAELANWARCVLSMTKLDRRKGDTGPLIARFAAVKRSNRSGIVDQEQKPTDSTVVSHSDGYLFWQRAEEPENTEEDEISRALADCDVEDLIDELEPGAWYTTRELRDIAARALKCSKTSFRNPSRAKGRTFKAFLSRLKADAYRGYRRYNDGEN